MTRDKADYAVLTVEKALDMLEVLSEGPADATLPGLAGRLGISRNKAFRLMATLEKRGLAEHEERSGRYRLGLTAVELAQRFIKGANLIKLAHPVMSGLARKHDEAVYMTVLRGDEVLFLDMVDCDRQVKAAPLVGKRFPFFTNASGKAIKAHETSEMLGRPGRKRERRNASPDLDDLERELSIIREKGVAIDSEGLGEGVISVAVAVRDYAGKVIGALTMLGPSFRMVASRLENEIIPSLMEGAEILSMKLGYARG
jgi:DNA-binding IclR family transcriptional regulator